VQAFSTASAPSATASALAMLGSTDRELEEKVLVALEALVTDAGLFFVFFSFFFYCELEEKAFGRTWGVGQGRRYS